jgi:peptidoglycan/xylan/chitin deacetylase (PgdA/CDA1 family)
MLTHRTTSVLFAIILVVLVALDFTYRVHWYWYALLLSTFLSIEFYGAYFVHSNFHIKTICKVNTNDKIVALTFDDGPMRERTDKILNLLSQFNVKATFFCIGNRIKGNEDLVNKIHEQGHLIGNHSYSHSNLFDLKNTKQMLSDLEEGNNEIKRVIGKKPLFFRPPYGVTTPSLARASKKIGYEVIGWNVRSFDTTIKDKQQLVERVTSRIQPGSILLFHDTVDNLEMALEEILQDLKRKEYRVVELDKLIQRKAYA